MKKKKFKSKVNGVTCTTVGGREYWYVWMDGVRHPADSQKDAEDARKKFDARKVDAQRTGLDLKTKGAFADFVSMANWYLTVPQIKRLASYDRACGVVANLVNYFGKAPVAAITPARQEDYRDHRREQGAVEATINLEITYLAMIFKLALKRKKIHPHQMPGEFVRATKKEVEKESPPRRLITDDEYQRILDHAPEDFRDVCICANETSMRGKEIVTLRVKQIFLDKVVSRVPTRVASILEVMDCKNGMRKAVPISPVLRQVLERRIEGLKPDDFVFTRKKRQTVAHKRRVYLQADAKNL